MKKDKKEYKIKDKDVAKMIAFAKEIIFKELQEKEDKKKTD